MADTSKITRLIRPMFPAKCGSNFNPNREYYVEDKVDGHRAMLYASADRRRAVVTGTKVLDVHRVGTDSWPIFLDHGENVPHLSEEIFGAMQHAHVGEIVLDGEITVPGKPFEDVQSVMGSFPERAIHWQETNEKAVFTIFDLLRYNGKDLRKLPLQERSSILWDFLQTSGISSEYFKVVRRHRVHSFEESKEFFDRVVEKGGEGIVLKPIDSQYGEGWVKWKKEETYDVVVMGFSEGNGKYRGMFGAVHFGAYRGGKLFEIGKCGGMKDGIVEWKYPEAPESHLDPEDGWLMPVKGAEQPVGSRAWFHNRRNSYRELVVEVKCNGVTKHGRLRHPRFYRVRNDKAARDCLAP